MPIVSKESRAACNRPPAAWTPTHHTGAKTRAAPCAEQNTIVGSAPAQPVFEGRGRRPNRAGGRPQSHGGGLQSATRAPTRAN